jgi:cytochrome P450
MQDASTIAPLDHELQALIESRPEAIVNPWPLYRRLLEEAPVYEFGPSTILSRHADVRAASRDAVGFSNKAYSVGSRAQAVRSRLSESEATVFDEVAEFEAMYISRSDGDQHERLRDIAHRAFAPRRIAELSSNIQGYTDDLLDEMIREGNDDLVTALSVRLPVMVICSLLDVPQSDVPFIKALSGRIGKNRGGTVTADLIDAHAALAEFRDYVSEIVEHHQRGSVHTELVEALMGAEHGDRLTKEELLAMIVVLLFAGSDTTSALIANGMYDLLVREPQWKLLCSDQARVPSAVEELMRYTSPVQFTWRVTTGDIKVNDVEIDAGRTVILLIAAANRDGDLFDRPDELDITREPNHHIGFLFGPHFCLGASLARLEAQTVFGTLSRRFPDMQLKEFGDLPWRGNAMFRNLARLPVELGRDRGRI